MLVTKIEKPFNKILRNGLLMIALMSVPVIAGACNNVSELPEGNLEGYIAVDEIANEISAREYMAEMAATANIFESLSDNEIVKICESKNFDELSDLINYFTEYGDSRVLESVEKAFENKKNDTEAKFTEIEVELYERGTLRERFSSNSSEEIIALIEELKTYGKNVPVVYEKTSQGFKRVISGLSGQRNLLRELEVLYEEKVAYEEMSQALIEFDSLRPYKGSENSPLSDKSNKDKAIRNVYKSLKEKELSVEELLSEFSGYYYSEMLDVANYSRSQGNEELAESITELTYEVLEGEIEVMTTLENGGLLFFLESCSTSELVDYYQTINSKIPLNETDEFVLEYIDRIFSELAVNEFKSERGIK